MVQLTQEELEEYIAVEIFMLRYALRNHKDYEHRDLLDAEDTPEKSWLEKNRIRCEEALEAECGEDIARRDAVLTRYVLCGIVDRAQRLGFSFENVKFQTTRVRQHVRISRELDYIEDNILEDAQPLRTSGAILRPEDYEDFSSELRQVLTDAVGDVAEEKNRMLGDSPSRSSTSYKTEADAPALVPPPELLPSAVYKRPSMIQPHALQQPPSPSSLEILISPVSPPSPPTSPALSSGSSKSASSGSTSSVEEKEEGANSSGSPIISSASPSAALQPPPSPCESPNQDEDAKLVSQLDSDSKAGPGEAESLTQPSGSSSGTSTPDASPASTPYVALPSYPNNLPPLVLTAAAMSNTLQRTPPPSPTGSPSSNRQPSLSISVLSRRRSVALGVENTLDWFSYFHITRNKLPRDIKDLYNIVRANTPRWRLFAPQYVHLIPPVPKGNSCWESLYGFRAEIGDNVPVMKPDGTFETLEEEYAWELYFLQSKIPLTRFIYTADQLNYVMSDVFILYLFIVACLNIVSIVWSMIDRPNLTAWQSFQLFCIWSTSASSVRATYVYYYYSVTSQFGAGWFRITSYLAYTLGAASVIVLIIPLFFAYLWIFLGVVLVAAALFFLLQRSMRGKHSAKLWRRISKFLRNTSFKLLVLYLLETMPLYAVALYEGKNYISTITDEFECRDTAKWYHAGSERLDLFFKNIVTYL